MRLPQVLDWLPQAGLDIACLQETKLQDADFPFDALKAAGYEALAAGTELPVPLRQVLEVNRLVAALKPAEPAR